MLILGPRASHKILAEIRAAPRSVPLISNGENGQSMSRGIEKGIKGANIDSRGLPFYVIYLSSFLILIGPEFSSLLFCAPFTLAVDHRSLHPSLFFSFRSHLLVCQAITILRW